MDHVGNVNGKKWGCQNVIYGCLGSYCDETRPTPIVILLNKYDQDNALPMKEVVLSLGLEDILSEWGNEEESDESDESDDEDSDGNENGKIPPPPIEVFCCSVVENRGYQAAFKWLSEFIE